GPAMRSVGSSSNTSLDSTAGSSESGGPEGPSNGENGRSRLPGAGRPAPPADRPGDGTVRSMWIGAGAGAGAAGIGAGAGGTPRPGAGIVRPASGDRTGSGLAPAGTWAPATNAAAGGMPR